MQINIAEKSIIAEYEKILGVKAQGNLLDLAGLHLVFCQGEGPDLTANMDKKLDLMLLRFQVSQSFDLAQFADNLPDEKLYLDKSKNVGYDIPHHMELWFTKQGL